MIPAPQDVQATFCATLVDQWIGHGLCHAVIAPGSRSTPMAMALAARPDLQLHVVHDERSAAFVALGIGLATGIPALLLCTSGTAATHFHAAIVEAHQSAVPMVVVTADRPPELHGVGAPQTIEQGELYGSAVRWFHDPGVAQHVQRNQWRSVAATAWTAATDTTPGPVHLNLPFREPLVGVAGELPPEGEFEFPDEPWTAHDGSPLRALRHGVIVTGHGAGSPADVQALAIATGWPVLADPMSGCQLIDGAVMRFDAILRHSEFAATHQPELVVQLGRPPASRVLAQWLAASAAHHVAVSPAGLISDPNLVGAEQVHAPIGAWCRSVVDRLDVERDQAWHDEWLSAEQAARTAIDGVLTAEAHLSEPGTARALTAAVPAGSHLVVASSMPVRDVEWFGTPRHDVTVHSNRGANGIDGVIATAIGVAIGSGATTTVLLGDVAFCHDSSSLTALRARHLDLKIVVVDNDGGAIFSFLPQASSLDSHQFEQLFGTPHGTDIVALARAHGLRSCTADTAEALGAAFHLGDTCVVRVASNRSHNAEVHAALHAAVIDALG